MRTVKFQKVFDNVVRMLGRDPMAEVPQDLARSIVQHINERAEAIHQAWDWPEWQVTEERAFRQVWNSSKQYLRSSSSDGKPDEVFYLGTGFVPGEGAEFGTGYGYYRVNSDALIDPPVGTLPTNTTYFTPFDLVDAYVEYDQPCRRSIGRVLGAYKANPRANGCGCGGDTGTPFKPSERGIDVRCSGGLTVFLTYLMPVPEYSIVPHVIGRTYTRGEVAFDPTSGECYQVVAASTNNPISLPDWRWIPFLQKWSTFVVQGAFADCFGEFDQGGNEDLQAKLALAGRAEAKAMQALEARIDELTSQGQVLKYNACDRSGCNGWCESAAFTGGTVSDLSSECQDELGWVYPPHPEIQFTSAEDITGLTAILNGLNYVDVVFTEAMTNSQWLLVEAHVINTADASPLNLETGIMGIKTAAGFRIALNGLADSNNYRLAWIVRPSIAVPSAEEATTYLLSGPSMG